MIKKCFKCKIPQKLSEYYVHKQMKDGHLNKCKSCTKNDVSIREINLRKNPDWVEKEKERCKEKYSRLGYVKKQKEWDSDRPWKQTNKYKGLHKKLRVGRGFELHHWNYTDGYLEDVFIMQINNHRKLHTLLKFIKELLIFSDLDGNLLDTKEKHQEYILKCKINIEPETL